MAEYILKDEDYKLIDKLIEVTTSIETQYKKLYDLEINNNKDTKEYTELLNYLNNSIEAENKIYKDADLTSKRSIALLNFIMAKYFPLGTFLENTESIMNQNYDNKVPRRIINILKDNYTNGIEILSEDTFDLFTLLGINKQETYKNVWKTSLLNTAFNRDTISAYLTFLQDFINDEHYRNLKSNLIRSKYYATFIYKQIESEIANNNFNIPDSLYFISKFTADLNKIDFKDYNFSKNLKSFLNSSFQISKLLEINDMDYNDPKSVTTSILRQCLIRSYLLLMNDENIAKVNNDFHELTDNQKYINEHPNNQISENIIIDCFRKVKKDREKSSTLSLKRN